MADLDEQAEQLRWAHDAYCNTIHELTSEPCPPPVDQDRTGAVTIAYVAQNEVSFSWHKSMMEIVGADAAGSRRLARGGFIAMRCGTDGLPEARNKAVETFLEENTADWLFWIDTDMGFGMDTVDRLFAAADPVARPIVGALCFANSEEAADGLGGFRTRATPTVYDWAHARGPDGSDQFGWQVRWAFKPDTVTRVSGTGSACVLIHRGVFEKIEAEHGRIWYQRVPNTSTGQLIAEDLSFCLRAGALGIPIHVHTGVPTTHFKPVWLGEERYWQERAIASAAEAFAQSVEPDAQAVTA